MDYKNIRPAKFLSRPNRFIANIEIDGRIELCHVKNTGRCKELLLEGAAVSVQMHDNPSRRTKYDLISVYKGPRLVNMDSQIPNRVFQEWIKESRYFGDAPHVRPEQRYGSSRFDFYIEAGDRKIFVEVKGVTLEEDNVALFPDAPTERGVKHLKELIRCRQEGFEAYAVFIVQMKDVRYFVPNHKTHRAFAEALREASQKGVRMLALDCHVTEDSIRAGDFVEVRV